MFIATTFIPYFGSSVTGMKQYVESVDVSNHSVFLSLLPSNSEFSHRDILSFFSLQIIKIL